ncbi:biotin-dependent carboxyltransferase family protein [Mangrovivirga sp. M17]|uniref:Biotin-dependent carboxyltransferase family protein n=1 Tax=Mangrovivirga halotolerans TaxID=2993936 RepID=A0ABT3RVT0_9BACT|nr:biotin-dependent carboxyltransferase family protein [Mangrovivirga halotolerans]MCX2745880.1 biotin-dependent carboxyltransferase family protein [Mangrovivirga halotolerans]
MTSGTLRFINGGMFTVIQDSGREGYRQFGIPSGGFLDRKTAGFANRLLGKPTGSALIEITLLGPEFIVSGSLYIALCGPPCEVYLNGVEAEMNKPLALHDGDIIKIGRVKSGCRVYLAFSGEPEIPEWLGSSSAASIISSLATPWAIIKKGYELNLRNTDLKKSDNETSNALTEITFPAIIRAIPGPEFDCFLKKDIRKFFKMEHEVLKDSNRMGVRLKSSIVPNNKKNMISSGVVPGTIQITENGLPILLLADAQTTGGYLRIANVIEEDLDRCAQLRPGEQFLIKLNEFED